MRAWYDAGTIARELAAKADPARIMTHRIRDDATPGWTPEAREKATQGGRATGMRLKTAQEVGKAPQKPGLAALGAKKPSRLPGILTLARIASAGLPAPVPEYRFAAPRRWRADYAWPDRLVLLEVEGAVFAGGRHVRGKGYEADMEKYNAATLAGYRVLRYSTGQMRGGQWLADLARVLA